MTTTYLATAAVTRLDEAQRLLDAHVMLFGSGACRLCGRLQGQAVGGCRPLR